MHRAKYVISVLFALAAILGITGWWLYRAAQPIELACTFILGSGAAGLNESPSQSGWRGSFQKAISSFFLSNIRATGAGVN
jgi:hypothetical protein